MKLGTHAHRDSKPTGYVSDPLLLNKKSFFCSRKIINLADLFADKNYLKERKYVANDAGGHDGKAVHGEGLAQEQVLP